MKKYFRFCQNFEEANLKKFVDDFLAEKVPQHFLTEKLPEDWDQKPVKVADKFNAVFICVFFAFSI